MTSSHEIINAHPTLLRVSGTIDGQDQFDKAWMANREGRQFPFLESTSDGSDSDREPSMAAIERVLPATTWLTFNAGAAQSFPKGDKHEQ